MGRLSGIVTVDKLLRGAGGYPVVMKNRIYHPIPIAVQQRLYGGRGRVVEQRRDSGRFVAADDLRARSRAVPDLMMNRLTRLNGCRADSLVAEQLVRGCLLIVLPFPVVVVEYVLVMVSTVFIVVKGLGLARVHLRERRLRLIVLGIAGGVGEGVGCWRGAGRFARFRRRRAGRRCGGSSRRRTLMMLVRWIRLIDVVLAVFVQTESDRVVSIEFQIQVVESLALAAIDLVDPLANPGFLIEHGPIQTEELYVHNLV